MPVESPKNAAALIIGNELLSGKVEEANLFVLANTLRALGIELRRVTMIPDELPLVAREVRTLAAEHDVLVTSGGIGPTHDDVTLAAVASAFDVPMVSDPHLESMLRHHYGERCTPGHLRMALIPHGAELVSNASITWPTILMRNVWVLPGIPEVFRMKIPLLEERLSGNDPFVSRAVYTRMDEGDLKPLLDEVVAAYPDIDVGSYPKWHDPGYKTKLTFDGRDSDKVSRATQAFLDLLPEGEPLKVE